MQASTAKACFRKLSDWVNSVSKLHASSLATILNIVTDYPLLFVLRRVGKKEAPQPTFSVLDKRASGRHVENNAIAKSLLERILKDHATAGLIPFRPSVRAKRKLRRDEYPATHFRFPPDSGIRAVGHGLRVQPEASEM